MRRLGNNLFEYAADWCFPKVCLGCGTDGCLLCPHCRLSLEWRIRRICPVCHRELPAGEKCHNSLLAGLWSLSPYGGLMTKLIKDFKYNGVTSLADEVFREGLGKFLALKPALPGNSVIVPVPLHHDKFLRRGFNQAESLAMILGDSLELPIAVDLLKRKINNKPQAQQGFEERSKNVQGIFTVDYRHLSDYWGRPILLVDDVYTTGSTVGECAKELAAAGFRDISAITLAFGG